MAPLAPSACGFSLTWIDLGGEEFSFSNLKRKRIPPNLKLKVPHCSLQYFNSSSVFSLKGFCLLILCSQEEKASTQGRPPQKKKQNQLGN